MRSRSLLYVVFCLLFLTACYNRGQQTPDAWDLTEHQIDSISFSTTHHYTQNYNFMVTANRLPLADALPDMAFDTLYVVHGDRIVVADIRMVPADTIDSVWVKVAHDQITQGWIRESELLQGVSPDDPISQFIDVFSDTHLLVFLAICVLVAGAYAVRKLLRRRAYIVHFHDIDSAYPALLCVLIAMSATLYASIQMFGAESCGPSSSWLSPSSTMCATSCPPSTRCSTSPVLPPCVPWSTWSSASSPSTTSATSSLCSTSPSPCGAIGAIPTIPTVADSVVPNSDRKAVVRIAEPSTRSQSFCI